MSGGPDAVPLMLEDFAAGDVLSLGPRSVPEAEIVAFAAEFDPQPMHLSEAGGAGRLAGGLIASGWHMGAVGMRMLYDGWIGRTASLGSPGIERVRWLRPVRPGDTLTGTSTVLDVRVSNSMPDRGFVRMRNDFANQDGVAVMVQEGVIMVARRART